MENKDIAYQLIDNDAVRMNNGDNMVDVYTAYQAIDRARSDERHQLLAGWEPTTKPIPTTDLVDVFLYPYIKVGYAVAWRRRYGDTNDIELEK